MIVNCLSVQIATLSLQDSLGPCHCLSADMMHAHNINHLNKYSLTDEQIPLFNILKCFQWCSYLLSQTWQCVVSAPGSSLQAQQKSCELQILHDRESLSECLEGEEGGHCLPLLEQHSQHKF